MPEQQSITRGFMSGIEVRSIDEKTRTATFVASTENPVETWDGPEYLDMDGVDLKRYRKNPVVLDAHNRWSSGSVIGKADVSVEGRELIASMSFAETQRADEVWKLVKGGFLRAVSVGFMPMMVDRISEKESATLGERTVKGPARIVRKWMLYEISTVPVPADSEALRRSLSGLQDDLIDLLLGARTMSKEQKKESAQTEPAETEKRETAKPAEVTPVTAEVRTLHSGPPTEAEIEARNIQARKEAIMAICPRGLESVAERCIIENKTVEESRKAMLDEYTKRSASAGTTEPKPVEREEKEEKTSERSGPTKMSEVTDDVLLRSL